MWKVINILLTFLLKALGNKGMLPTKKDIRDRVTSYSGSYTPRYPQRSSFQYQFNQNPFNICVFASTILALSEQIGVRLSVRFIVALAQREGYITVRVERIEEIRAKVERTEQAVNEIKGQVSIISQALGINKSVSINQ